MTGVRTIFLGLSLFLGIALAIGQTISKGDYHFEFGPRLDCGPVEDQAATGTCWSFSTGSFFESEVIRKGKIPVNLSEMFYVRLNYLEKADLYLRYHGTNNFDEGSLSHDVLRLYKKYGAMPEEAYKGLTGQSTRHNHGRFVREMRKYLDTMISEKSISRDWRDSLNAIMDQHLGILPDTFTYEGEKYTAMTFAKKFIGIDPDDYVTITSFSHHDTYSFFVLEIPDNYARESYYNVTLTDLVTITDHALKNGHSVVWDCDVSEAGFSARQGLAIVPASEALTSSRQTPFDKPSPEITITPELRQEEFDTYSLTDDHLMHIVGMAQDQNGKSYYYVKNSWGNNVGFDGYLFASQPYFELNTIAITLNLEAIPLAIRESIIASSASQVNE